MGTYANMYAMEEINTTIVTEKSSVIGNQIIDFEKNIMKAVEGESIVKIEKGNSFLFYLYEYMYKIS